MPAVADIPETMTRTSKFGQEIGKQQALHWNEVGRQAFELAPKILRWLPWALAPVQSAVPPITQAQVGQAAEQR